MRKLKWYQYFVNPIVWVFSQLYRLVFGSMFNFWGNVLALAKLIKHGKLKKNIREYRSIKRRCKTFDDFAEFYTQFNYEFDGISSKACNILKKWPTWTAPHRS